MSHLRDLCPSTVPVARVVSRITACLMACVWVQTAVVQAASLQATSYQNGSNEPEKIFQESIGVEIINIDVAVTDKKGYAVEGLKREDFKLEIDGKEVPIANFYALSSKSVAPDIPEHLRDIDDVAELARPPLHIVVYVDSVYLLPTTRQRVMRDLPAFFEDQVAAGAKIMLIEHRQENRVLAPFTDDLNQLQAALEKLEKAPADGIHERVARRRLMNEIATYYTTCNDPCNTCWQRMVNTVEQYSRDNGYQRASAMANLGNVVNALAVLDGKKALLHVSDGIQQQAGVDFYDFLVDKLCPQKRMEITQYLLSTDVSDLNEVVAQANASRVTLYTLEAAGLRGLSSSSAEYGSGLFTPSAQNDMLRVANLQDTLHFLARETGGKAIVNANKFAPDLAKLTGEFRTYYSLGYQPAHVGEGSSHKVSVKVPKNKTVDRVRYRRSFLHKKPEHLLADKALGAVMFGLSENPLGAEVRAKTEGPVGEGLVTVALEISVPYENLVLIPRDELREGRLQLILTVPDPKGKVAIRKMNIPISIDATQASGDFQFGVNLKLEASEHHLGVSLWDELAASGSFLSLQNPVSPELAADLIPPAKPDPGRRDGR